jgi:small subunit ribosomal protein S1
MAKSDDQYREKFRADADPALEKEISDALGGFSIEDLIDEKASKQPAQAPAAKGQRRGRIARVDLAKNEVLVDFGGKDQGVCPLGVFVEEPSEGQEHDFVVVRRDPREDILVLSLPGAKATHVSWENLQVGQIVEGTVTGVNKGGLEVDVKGMRAFMPAGQVDIGFVKDTSEYIGQRVTAEVTRFEREARNMILSRRNVIEREREAAKAKMLESLQVGQTVRGTVRNVMDFGAFVDLGGLDGLVHVSEMSWKRTRNAADLVKVGDVVDVSILKIDRETGKLSLSMKSATPDPWLEAESKYPVGSTLTGRVMRLEAFGAFVEAEEGIEGLLPISEMSYQRIKHPSEIVKETDTIKVVVLSVDAKSRKMSFSLKQVGPDPWKTVEERYATDMVVTGKVTRVAEFGAFVELEPGLEGLVHVSELAQQRVRHVGDVAKPGAEVKVAVVSIDKESRRIGLSMKRVSDILPKGGESAPAAPAAPRKPRLDLRGGLDFEMRKNK